MADYITNTEELTSIANAIRGKTGKTASLKYPAEFVSEINSISGGGASNFVQGTFIANFTGEVEKGNPQTIDLPYTGNGYPVMVVIVVKGGAYNQSNPDWYNLIQQYAIGAICITKANMNSAPTYATSGADNYGVCVGVYKSSSTNATLYSRISSMIAKAYTTSDVNGGTLINSVKFHSNKTMSVFVSNTQYGFVDGMEYEYFIAYSS